ncbi:MAG: flagellar hook-length control protein FliK [Burkholderiales bacterium]|nr:flagellar hook-length control protein FliK [Burkholderiales bacterium]
MDALSLTLNTLANGAAAQAEGVAPVGESATPALDFATLLAAGLAPRPPLPSDASTLGQAQVQATRGEDDTEPAAIGAEPLAAPIAVQLLLPLALSEQPMRIEQAGAGDPAGPAQLLEAARLQARSAAPLAAAAATIAGDAGAMPGSSPGIASRAEALQSAAALAETSERSAPPEPAAHALHAGPVEQRSAPQPTAVLQIAAPVATEGFAAELAQQVVWMADKDAQVAELHINPPELGPIEVRLSLNGDEASAQFVSTHAEVRACIESSLLRLRESLAQAGIQLGEASVSAESFRDGSGANADAREGRHGYGRAHDESLDHPLATAARRGLVDTFA